ncbi:hypothetical protein ACJJTC_009148 [Scirpophaga incertulas]
MWNKSGLLLKQSSSFVNMSVFRKLQSAASYLHHPGTEPLSHITLSDALVQTVDKYPNRVALRSVYEDVTLTYDQLLTQADALGCALRAQGLEKGDRLGIWSHNNAGFVVALVAAARIGVISVLINPIYENPELSFCLKKTGVKCLFISENLPKRNYSGKLRELIPSLQDTKPGAISTELYPELTSIISAGKETLRGVFSYETLLKDYARQDASSYSKAISPEDGCMIFFTSGSTANPKAVLDSNLSLVNNTYFIGKRNGFDNTHQNVAVQSPLFHSLGCLGTLLAGFRHGATITLTSATYNVKSNVDSLYSEKCTVITGTPTMFIDILLQIKKNDKPPQELRTAMAAGAPCSPQLIRNMQKYLNVQHLRVLYGLSESTACIFQSLPEDDVETVADTVGYIQDHLEVKVIDAQGSVVPYGTRGELLSRGYNTMISYWNDPVKTKEVLTEDGWLKTGDEFKISKDGYGRIVGRIKDIIIKGGENIAPKEIEDLLNTHPEIIESQVVGVPDDRLGEELCAVVRVKPGSKVTLNMISDHLSGKLALFKIPKIVKYIEEYPKTASGKVQKNKIRDMVVSGKL